MSVVLSSDGQRDREERSDMGRVMQKRNYRQELWVQCGFILIIGNRSACSQHSFDVYY